MVPPWRPAAAKTRGQRPPRRDRSEPPCHAAVVLHRRNRAFRVSALPCGVLDVLPDQQAKRVRPVRRAGLLPAAAAAARRGGARRDRHEAARDVRGADARARPGAAHRHPAPAWRRRRLSRGAGMSEPAHSGTVEPAMRDALLAAVPSLRAFAISLTNNVDRADDLVQDTLLRAIAHIGRFERGTNLNAWLFTILRNLFHSEYRKRRREVEDPEGSYASHLASPPEQGAKLDLADLRVALTKLPPDQREALLLVGAAGLPYEDVAAIMDCAVGTVKSRVNRARLRLAQLLGLDGVEDLGPDRLTRAAIHTSACGARAPCGPSLSGAPDVLALA